MKTTTQIFSTLLSAGALMLGLGISLPSHASEKMDLPSFRELLKERDVEPLDPKPEYPEAKLKLGQALFFDPLLGGNQDVSCATCHHPLTASADGRSRAVGTLAYVDKGRRLPVGFSLVEVNDKKDMVLTGFNMSGAAHPFTPRNSPEIFNRGDSAWTTMFWDSRAHQKEDGGFAVNQMRLSKSPGLYQAEMPPIIENILAAQAMMPVLSADEMRGAKGQTGATGSHNEVGQINGRHEEEIWAVLMKRLLDIEGYRELFSAAYPDIPLEDLHFAHAANAIAAFEIDSFTLLDSPWDRFLAGDDSALSEAQLAGAQLFYGKAQCYECHSGKLLTDQETHNIGVIPIGPGPDLSEDADYGVAHRSNAGLDQKYEFRTPPLRNVELTGPYMHNGAYRTVEAAIRHHLDPIDHLENFDKSQLEPEFRGAVHDEEKIIKDVKKTLTDKLPPPALTEEEIAQLVEFHKALTAPSARDLTHVIPESVPSGLEMVAPIPETD